MGLNDIHSLSHTKWNCKYHIVFAPKYRRMVFYIMKELWGPQSRGSNQILRVNMANIRRKIEKTLPPRSIFSQRSAWVIVWWKRSKRSVFILFGLFVHLGEPGGTRDRQGENDALTGGGKPCFFINGSHDSVFDFSGGENHHDFFFRLNLDMEKVFRFFACRAAAAEKRSAGCAGRTGSIHYCAGKSCIYNAEDQFISLIHCLSSFHRR